MSPARTRRRISLAVVAVGVGVILTSIVLGAPIAVESSGFSVVNGHLYSFWAVGIYGGGPHASTFTYAGVTFHFLVDCTGYPHTLLCGTTDEPAGAHYSYTLVQPRFHSAPGPRLWQTWISPDGESGVQYQPGGLTHLLVEV